MLRAVLLDLDGTVLDSHALILSSWRHVRDTFGLTATDADFEAGMGQPLDRVLRSFAKDDAERDAWAAAYRAHNALHHDQTIRPFEGMPEALEGLRARGLRLAIVTSKTRAVAERGLALFGLKFDAVVGPTDAARPKPAPDPVLHALALLNVAPEHAVMVGDAPADLQAGRAAGVRTAAVSWGAFPRDVLQRHTPDHWLERPSDLLRL